MQTPKSGYARIQTANDLFSNGEHIAALVILTDVLADRPKLGEKSRNSILAKIAEIRADLATGE